MAKAIRRIFIANRGEIAVRIIASCRRLGIETVVGVSQADVDALPARLADRAVCIGPAHPMQSYLRPGTIVHAAKATGCDAVHPGYGFLSERPELPERCAAAGLVFIGPSADAIAIMGDKLRARLIAKELGVPTVPGSDHVNSAAEAVVIADQIGFPMLLKARAGGGGRGMRVVRRSNEVEDAFQKASAEAAAAFGDGGMYIERYIERARHIEIQVLGDKFGNLIHLGERDCSAQRRHQKLVEESPSPIVDPSLRGGMAEAALRLAAHVGYTSAGTVEFIVDEDSLAYYFLEMNTRIQVEHPVSEMVTGVDIVAEQIRIAAEQPLSIRQEDVRINGHAIECRINAEDPRRNFMPSPGRISRWRPVNGNGIRLDTHCFEGYLVPPNYDAMIAKLIVHGPDRNSAIEEMRRALSELEIEGISTTAQFHREMLNTPEFRGKGVTTSWVERDFLPRFSAGEVA